MIVVIRRLCKGGSWISNFLTIKAYAAWDANGYAGFLAQRDAFSG